MYNNVYMCADNYFYYQIKLTQYNISKNLLSLLYTDEIVHFRYRQSFT